MKITLKSEYIKLSQFLKLIKAVDTGGQTVFFLQKNEVTINGNKPEGKSSKIRQGDIVWVNDKAYLIE
ncbi:RNA-binding S4 domain-containing protein [Mycoplasma leonicaptivi]|uniref:RNA-binding S4 domain-containing protein n=1 Tax=Mycoplasma leonicaptivi TaxID=36742 RepID=UPI000481BA6C|nr:RNA-binding S4 domain-containing protein [Mycoplasma leonicaptivi]